MSLSEKDILIRMSMRYRVDKIFARMLSFIGKKEEITKENFNEQDFKRDLPILTKLLRDICIEMVVAQQAKNEIRNKEFVDEIEEMREGLRKGHAAVSKVLGAVGAGLLIHEKKEDEGIYFKEDMNEADGN